MTYLFVILTLAGLTAFIIWIALIEDKIEFEAQKAADEACKEMEERCQRIKWKYRSLKSKLETNT
tara:strand:- start:4781 stop:4975 length:195 start_codon:yes stop_codon:yes gene_type:complete